MPLRAQRFKLPQVIADEVLEKDFEELAPHERRWLQDTAYWPEGEQRQPVTFFLPDGQEISNDPSWLLSQGVNSPIIERLINERARQLADEMVAQAQMAERPPRNVEEFERQLDEGLAGAQQERGQGRAEAEGYSDSDLDVPDPPEPEPTPYESWGIQELRGLALRRGLSIEGLDGKKTGEGRLISNNYAYDTEHGVGIGEVAEGAETGAEPS